MHAAALFADPLKIFRGKVVLRQSLNNQERDIQRQTCLELESVQNLNFRLGIQTKVTTDQKGILISIFTSYKNFQQRRQKLATFLEKQIKL